MLRAMLMVTRRRPTLQTWALAEGVEDQNFPVILISTAPMSATGGGEVISSG
jgi:hypothetical protein